MEVIRRRPAPKALGPKVEERALPPRVAETLNEIDEAMALLGAFVQVGGNLRESRLEKLQVLVGQAPTVDQARAWKSGLRELRRELAELERRAR